MSVVSVEQVKARLNKSVSVDDGEIAEMIDAAERSYRRVVGPYAGTATKTCQVDLEGKVFLPRNTVSVGAVVEDSSGTAVTYDPYDEGDEGILRGFDRWQTVRVTYTLGLPADHREVIAMDVAGYFAATQRGGAARPQIPGAFEESFTRAEAGMPLAMFPRIRALADSARIA